MSKFDQDIALFVASLHGTIEAMGSFDKAIKRNKLAEAKQKADNAKQEAQKALKELYKTRCQYLADLLEATEQHDHFIISLCPQCLTVAIIDHRTRVYCRGFEQCENFLLKMLN